MLYFLAIPAGRFHAELAPPLGAAWRARSFAPARALAAQLTAAARDYAARYHTGDEEPLLARVAQGLPFDRAAWRMLVGEAMLYAAEQVPELTTALDTQVLLAPPHRPSPPETPRERLTPLEQSHRGARDLVLGGGYYRPEAAGLNDVPDVTRLAACLDALDPRTWRAEALAGWSDLDDEGRQDEAACARDAFVLLREFYRQARTREWVVVCEDL